MFHRPVCVKCQTEMQPERNDVGVLDYASFGPYAIWSADKWRCPKCNIEVVVGFGANALARHHQENFKAFIESYKKNSELIENFEYKG